MVLPLISYLVHFWRRPSPPLIWSVWQGPSPLFAESCHVTPKGLVPLELIKEKATESRWVIGLLGKYQHHILGNYWNFICLRLMTCNQRHCAKKAKIKYTLGRRRPYTLVTQEIGWTKETTRDTLDTVIFNSIVNKTRTKKFSNVYSRHKSYTSQKAFFLFFRS